MKIFASGISEARAEAELRRCAAPDELWLAGNRDFTAADRAAFLEAEVVLGGVPVDLLQSAARLRWIQLLSVGIDSYQSTVRPQLRPGVVCTNLRGVYAEAMAQSVLAGILAFTRAIPDVVKCQERRDWQKDRLHAQMNVIRGGHVLLLGGGSVPTRVRELLAAFGCTFTTYARTSGDIHTLAELDAALPRADIVCAALPDTRETAGLMDARRIGLLKPGALFANVGRGSLVDEAALVAALQANRIGGALIDVTRQEPLPPDDPLWRCPRVLLTQHSSAGSQDELLSAVIFFRQNLARYRHGDPLLNAVDWAKGY